MEPINQAMLLAFLQITCAASGHSAHLASSAPVAAEPVSIHTITRQMTPGVNMGNTLEAIPTATAWGNPVPTEAYFRGVRKAGFKSIRIPAAWTQYSDKNHNIDPKWMKHVTNVVRMAQKEDLIVMLNIHWDGGWLQPTTKEQAAAGAKLRRFWIQIANNFKSFDNRLLFAGTNETGVEGEYGPPAPDNAKYQNNFNQIFVNTVRATGGKNRDRLLVIQSYGTDINNALKVNTVMPKDVVKDRLIMEVHFYSPYNFTLNEKSDIWQWGKTATDPKATDTWGNEDHVDSQFAKMQSAFIDRGIPVILGEYCSGLKERFPGMDKYRRLWNAYVTESSVKHNMVPMLWDTGSIIDRKTGTPKDHELIQMIMKASKQKVSQK